MQLRGIPVGGFPPTGQQLPHGQKLIRYSGHFTRARMTTAGESSPTYVESNPQKSALPTVALKAAIELDTAPTAASPTRVATSIPRIVAP